MNRGPAGLLLTAGLAHLALAVAAMALPQWGDLAIFQEWAARFATSGIGNAYSSHATPELRYDWPPLYVYLSTGSGLLYDALGLRDRFGPAASAFGFVLKLPMIGLNLWVGWLLFRLAPRLYPDESLGRWAAAAWLWNPAIALATDVFGYQDALHTSLLVAAACALVAGRSPAAAVWMTLAALAKPQAWIFLAPFTAFLLRTASRRQRAWGALLALLVTLLVISPLLAAGQGGELVRAYLAMPRLHAWPSALAHNLWWAVLPAADEESFPSDLQPTFLGVSPRVLALLMLTCFCAEVVARLARRPDPRRLIGLSALLSFAFFMLATQMHENHLYAMFPFLSLAAAGQRFLRGVLLATTLTFAANLWLALHWLATGRDLALGWQFVALANALLNVGILLVWTRGALKTPASAGA
jgi:Gpi18-like mannosyltransferase